MQEDVISKNISGVWNTRATIKPVECNDLFVMDGVAATNYVNGWVYILLLEGAWEYLAIAQFPMFEYPIRYITSLHT